MATLDRPLQSHAVERRRERPAGSARFDLGVALLSLWFMVGIFVDGWAHNHGAVDNTFFTPYHALLYSGILATGLFLGIHQYRSIGKGYAFSRALPYGYNLSLIGVALFFIGGGFDFVWHSIFGFEANLSILLSPAHLVLATAGFLIMSGPLRAAWRRTNVAPTWANLLPVVLALLMIISVMTFFTQFANAFARADGFAGAFPPGDRSYSDALGVAVVLFTSTITMGVLLFGLRRWKLPFGAITLILAVNAVGMMLILWKNTTPWYVIAAPILAGLLGDVLLRVLKPSREHPLALRVFAFAVPFALYLIYFVLLITRAGIWWPIHMWLGVTFFAAVTSVFLSYLALPPALPSESESAL
ncbi:MAG TPA: hypothetical protein VHD90_20310 [Phototrophicaceae bacterium]|nr:hypothetical protein [Phototrophicaceae bacterium]